MPSFGEKLRRERETRNTTIEEISDSTGIGLSYLQALERDEFEELPGRAFGKLYIRAYAKVLEFDPAPLLIEYDREQQRRRAEEPPGGRPQKPIMVRPEMPAEPPREEPETETEQPDEALREEQPAAEEPQPDEGPIEIPIETASPEDAVEEPAEEQRVEAAPEEPVEPEPEESEPAPAPVEERTPTPPPPLHASRAPETRPDSRRMLLVATLIAIPLLIVVLWILVGSFGGDDPEPRVAAPPEQAAPGPEPAFDAVAVETEPEDPGPSTRTEVDESPAPSEEPDEPTPGPSGLVVDEFGVGRGVVNHRLEDPGDRFEEGEVVWFLTRVMGGRRGQRIRHVWLHEGSAVQSIDLVLGGPHWRTQSNKTLWDVGSWTVEVRDEDSRVLATAAFTCVRR